MRRETLHYINLNLSAFLDLGDDAKSIGLLMKRVAGRQTRYVNKQEHHTGSLWDGRYKMIIVDSDTCFLQCRRYIEFNPVNEKMVTRPEHYLWSSYRENVNLSPSKIVGRSGFKKLSEGSFIEEFELRTGIRLEYKRPGRQFKKNTFE